jgi:hypothetical protein
MQQLASLGHHDRDSVALAVRLHLGEDRIRLRPQE